jgi:sodium/proline symporter
MWVGRFSVLIISLCAFLLSLNPASKVLDLVAFAWGGFGAAFGPTIILCLLWKRMTLYGAFAGILVGGVTVFVWDKMLKGGIFDVYEIVPGFIFSMIAIVVVSLLSKPPQNIDHVFSIKEM